LIRNFGILVIYFLFSKEHGLLEKPEAYTTVCEFPRNAFNQKNEKGGTGSRSRAQFRPLIWRRCGLC